MKFVFFFLIFSFAACADPSESDCNYYLEAEEHYKCGPKGYLLNFGHRLCEKYLSAEPNSREGIKTWFPKVRLCLQNYIQENHGTLRDCEDLKKKALNSHVKCYLDTGFCDLNFKDEAQLLRITSGDLFRPSILSLSFKVKRACQ